MKKILLFLGLLAFLFACNEGVNAQERTVYLNGGSASSADGYGTIFRIDKGDSRLTYTGTAADTLKETNQDTIAFSDSLEFCKELRRVINAEEHINGTYHVSNIVRQAAIVSVRQYRFDVPQATLFHLFPDSLYCQLVDIHRIDLPLCTYQFGEYNRIPARTTTVVDHGHTRFDAESPDTLLDIPKEEKINDHEYQIHYPERSV